MVAFSGLESVPARGPGMLLTITAATAPASAAFAALIANVQPPRRMKAIVPVYDWEAKSPAVQPVSASSGTTATGAVMPPAGVDGEYVIASGWRSRAGP
jgi:hypothetical protein